MKKILLPIFTLLLVVSTAVPATAQLNVDGTLEATGEMTGTAAMDAAKTIKVEVGESFTLDASNSVDTQVVQSFEWRQTGGPMRVDLEQETESTASATATEPGTYEFELVVTETVDAAAEVVKTVEVVVASQGSMDADATMEMESEGSMGSEGSMDSDSSMEAESEASTDASMRSDSGLLMRGGPVLLRGDSATEVGIDVRMRARSQTDAESEDGNQESSAEANAQANAVSEIHVSGATVRGWSQEKKDAVIARINSQSEVTTANDFGLYVAAQAIENQGVSEIDVSEERAEVRFDTRIKLFGVIPMNVKARAQANAEGRVKVKYPWYAFLATKGDVNAEAYTSLAADIRARHDAHMNSVRNMK